MSELNASRVDPDQTPHSVASDLGLHYLLMSHLWDTRLKWINYLHMPQKQIYVWCRLCANGKGSCQLMVPSGVGLFFSDGLSGSVSCQTLLLNITIFLLNIQGPVVQN